MTTSSGFAPGAVVSVEFPFMSPADPLKPHRVHQ